MKRLKDETVKTIGTNVCVTLRDESLGGGSDSDDHLDDQDNKCCTRIEKR